MKLHYETTHGVAGHIEAATRGEALQLLYAQYGVGDIALVDGRDPATVQNGDDHGWDAAFKVAAERTR